MSLRERATSLIADEMFHDAHHELWSHFGQNSFFDVQERLIESAMMKLSQRMVEVECLEAV